MHDRFPGGATTRRSCSPEPRRCSKAHVLTEVAQARADATLPSQPGETVPTYYDEHALTEDNHITLAVKTLGYRCESPEVCGVTTEVMSTWRQLANQRMRWQRGALENLGQFGLTRVTLPYWRQQIGQGAVIVLFSLFLIVSAVSMATVDPRITPFTMVGGIFFLERCVTVWRREGWGGRMLAAAMLPELLFDMVIMSVFIWSFVKIAARQERNW